MGLVLIGCVSIEVDDDKALALTKRVSIERVC